MPIEAKPAATKPVAENPAAAVAGNAESIGRPAPTSAPIEKPTGKIDTQPAEVAALPSPNQGIDAPYRPDTGAAAAPSAVEQATPVAKAMPKPEAKPETPVASRIVVRAKSNSWIQVRDDVGNQLLLTRILRAGDTYPVPNRSGLMLLTGNAGALEIQVDGETVPGIGGGAVRRAVALDVERLRQGKAVVD